MGNFANVACVIAMIINTIMAAKYGFNGNTQKEIAYLLWAILMALMIMV